MTTERVLPGAAAADSERSDGEIWPELERMAGVLDELVDVVAGLAAPAGGGPPPPAGEEPTLYFAGVESFVHEMFLPLFGWRFDGHRWFWCAQWWRHAEAIWRLELLWRSWEASRLQATGMSAWSVELDRHLRELCGPDGVFHQCRLPDGELGAAHEELAVPEVQAAPAGWWG